jgi:hypothetical protein
MQQLKLKHESVPQLLRATQFAAQENGREVHFGSIGSFDMPSTI